MFQELFDNPEVIAHHRGAPYREQREIFLGEFHQQSYSRGTLRRTAREVLWVVKHCHSSNRQKLTIEKLRMSMRRWARRPVISQPAHSPRWAKLSFLLTAVRWFRFIGQLKEEAVPTPPKFMRYLDGFAEWMREERGLSPVTIHVRRRYTRCFLAWCEKRNRNVGAIDVRTIDAYFATGKAQQWSRQTIANHANSLRAFFRYAEMRGWCKPRLAHLINQPRIYQQEGLPSGPSWPDVQRLIAETKSDRPSDIRTRALLILFAVYGFRSSEVANLRLEDIDWDNDKIRIWRPKQRKFQTYPLISTLGNSIIRYLREVRPQSSFREIFLSLRPPFRPSTLATHACMLSRLMQKLGIQSRRRGPHALRHACATHLVDQGFSLKEIGDHLGHRSSDSTRIYAKVNLPALRAVANFDIGGVL